MQLNDDLLWDFADGLLADAEAQEIRKLLAASPEWQARLMVVQAERAALKKVPLDRPRPGFADRVMTAWVTEQTGQPAKAPAKDWIAYAIAGALGLLIAAPLFTVIAVAFNIETKPSDSPLPLKMPPVAQFTPFFQSQGLLYALLLVATLVTWQFIDRYIQLHKTSKAALNV
jgi:anti-sigma factor RsiW